MTYAEITEAVDAATERGKIADANAKASAASQTYQRTVRSARDQAAAAHRRLNSPKPPQAPKPAPFPGEG